MTKKTFRITESCEAIIYLKARDSRLSKIIEYIGEIDCNIHDDSYSFVVNEIIGQMLSNKVADKIANRLEELCCGDVSPQKVSELSISDMRRIGISKAKSQYIINFTDAIKNKQLNLDKIMFESDEKIMETLMSIKGIGVWTSKMYLLFVLNRPDILPFEDGAFLQAYRWLYETNDVTPSSVKRRCKNWKPYSSTAARYLYRALDMGLVKDPFSRL